MYFLIAVADGDGVVPETSETNNVWSAAIRVGPDLTIASLTVPRQATAGATIAIADQTKNVGAAAGDTITYLYLSSNFTLDASDVLLGTRAIGPLATGAVSAGTTSVTVPGGMVTGHYYVFAVADGAGSISEAVETNNTSIGSIDVTAP